MGRFIRFALVAMALLLAGTTAAVVWGRAQLRGSLPQLDGARQLPGLTAPVRITRDALGIPTVHAATRADAARATGFLHAQDRFFQMDLSRRRAAGELAALVGRGAVPLDRRIRIHRFRAEAHRAIDLLSAGDRELLDAYTAGVNAGLAALSARPFEYLLLRQPPVPWRAEDVMLVVLGMFIALEDDDGSYEAALGTMHDVLPPAMFDLLAPHGSEWDAPLVGPPFVTAPIPEPAVYDLRAKRIGKPPRQLPSQAPDFERTTLDFINRERDVAIGSNSFVVAGHLTPDGRPLLANDMHLAIRVPNTWYRISLEWPDAGNATQLHRVTGITVPGAPAVFVGSNERVAWGFAAGPADWSDIVLIDSDSAHPNAYRTPDGWREFERHDETIEVAGQQPERQTVLWTIWGPLLEPDGRGRRRAYRWVAHSAEQLATSVTPIESARTVTEVFDEANGLGAPGMNIIVADASGHIGWSIYGSIPRRTGFDGRLPTSWADGSRKWDGWLSDAQYPRIVDPPSGRLWTANARVVNGEMLALAGDGNYEIGSRAHIIRDRLFARDRFTVRDLLDIQLDVRAEFLARWRVLLLQTLTDPVVAGSSNRGELRDVVDKGWSGEAAPDSAAYRLVRVFRESVSARVVAFVLAECYEADSSFDYTEVRLREAAIWKIVSEQPLHLLDPQYESWTELLLASVDDAITQAMKDRRGSLRERVWSEYNVVAFRHPLSPAIPIFRRWLDMPVARLPGDLYTPRLHWGAFGASQRMIVSPGHEAEGVMQMPTGQSGHPLSPFYANSHGPWVAGEPTPFLPGPPVHTLRLMPAGT
jgi:penicillin G amidase